MKIVFTSHATQKLKRLSKLGITKEKIVSAVKNPTKVEEGYLGRRIAQTNLTGELVLRVVHEERNNSVLIITAYPGIGRRYR